MKSILVVEDSKFLRVAIERMLLKSGYKVVTAGDGEEALRVGKSSAPDLILLDMMLPKLSGPEVLQALKKDPTTAKVPVVVLSGLSQKNEEKLKAGGAAAYIEESGLDAAHGAQLLELVRQNLS